MLQSRLSQEDWIAAGFRALAKGGSAALRVEAIARDLKTTKGSFYWHFKDLKAFKSAMIAFWKEQATHGIIDELEELPKGRNRLVALIEKASSTPDHYGGNGVEPAIRDWARIDAEVAAALLEIDVKRIAYLQQELKHLGEIEMAHARLFYAAHLGLEQLARTTGQRGEVERLLLLSLMQKQ
ncbi:Bacterial regulatory proteins, tetR family [Pelagimonas phthalicica]|uniref:Bacterial regulatory proteins, tetR family n=1 Tax=Pelagimonas phthalicica TaxID=1037362 RepID=A0A238JEW5_9RHOB|nr:TetR/AcrR family transcriptional regulator [Pelagimonas phthalicica]TDS91915.1 TetR family transcriptional regulator [Pelagimonas phthalicica]SMX28965.1 Bacterial regulatory proteins, tetR family [Pelagimonas phthalicica]